MRSPQLFNGPWSTCGGPNNNGTGAIPKGALVNTEIGAPIPVCNSYRPWQAVGFLGTPLVTQDRENVMNFHFGMPHKNDAGRDDVQALFYNFAYHQQFGGTIDQQGSLATLNSNLPQWGGTTGIANSIFGLGPYPGENGPYANLCAYQIIAVNVACSTGGSDPSVLRYAEYSSRERRSDRTPRTRKRLATCRRARAWRGNDHRDQQLRYHMERRVDFQTAVSEELRLERVRPPDGVLRVLRLAPIERKRQGEGFTGNSIGTTGEDYPSPDYELTTHTRGLQLQASDQINAKLDLVHRQLHDRVGRALEQPVLLGAP